jgi:prephenate dehydrogenase
VEKKVIGLIHPGEMGAAVGAALTAIGREVLWASDGRSDETKARALDANLRDVSNLDELAKSSDLIISIVPPHGAIDMAKKMAGNVLQARMATLRHCYLCDLRQLQLDQHSVHLIV